MKSKSSAKSNGKLQKRVKVKKTKIGRGVFARRSLDVDTIIGEIDGQVMDADFVSDYCIDLGGKAGLDPMAPFRFLNHSCEPCCELVLWKRRKDTDEKLPRVWLVATRDIEEGEELTIDYGWPKEQALRCLCGSKNCRGWVVDAEDAKELSRAAG